MNLRDRRGLKQAAAQMLEQSGSNHKQLVLLVSVITAGLSLLAIALEDGFSALISQQVGLAAMNNRTLLETVATVLSLVMRFAGSLLSAGYLYAMLRISRQQPADQSSLLWGFRNGFAVFRLYLFRILVLTAWTILGVYAASFLVTLLPWAQKMMAPAVQMLLDGADISDPQIMLQMTQSMLPIVAIMIAAGIAAMLPQLYAMRMADYVLMDNPRLGAMAAIYCSRQLTRGSRWSLLGLDLSFWWFYALMMLAEIPLQLPQLLGISGLAAKYGSYLLYAVATVIVQYFFLNRVQVTLCLSYRVLEEANRPPEQPQPPTE